MLYLTEEVFGLLEIESLCFLLPGGLLWINWVALGISVGLLLSFRDFINLLQSFEIIIEKLV